MITDMPMRPGGLLGDGQPQHSFRCLLYETFAPTEALRLLKRLEIHYTPKHGRCLDRRISTSEVLRQEISAWQARRNQEAVGANWKFTTEDARVKLRELYPSFPVMAD